MEIELLVGLLMPFALTLTVAKIRTRRRKVADAAIVCTIQGAA